MVTNANKEYEPAHVPYLAPVEPTVTPGSTQPGSQLPTIATLPPIASARPPLQNQLPTTNVGASNIPVVNGVRQTPATFASHVTQPHYPPTVVNLSALPSAAPPHALPEQLMPPFFEYMDKCRYVAGFMLCYYVCTFFFLQPFFLGTLGIMTGFLGYFGARPPIYAGHVKWVRGFIWMNYSMVVMNVWYLAITVFFISSFKSLERDSSTAADGSGSKDSTVYYHTYNEEHLGLFIGVVVALNLMLHFRGIRAAKHFHAEMLRAGPLPGHRTVIVLGSQQPVQQV